ncbi:peptide chain release factor 2 [Hydrogenibacillus schlegelii]|uniref:Peptide chain release factor 2 n=2 Tax=Hydrogenibacillus schlegelii TaxID=1484 RepID=A0A947CUC4_HYDSH|nr:peptide chain release factor 2 [Hydrogenibacillus schlegelii]MBT9281209.1 peptide chain release factor 2 [Hydrogenibacillus schlegelii]
MDLYELRQDARRLFERLWALRGSLDPDGKRARLETLEAQMGAPDFWSDPERAQQISAEAHALRETIEAYEDLVRKKDDIEALLELIKEEEDPELVRELEATVKALAGALEAYELELMLSGPYDGKNAILEIHPGAGGTESQDWASMLFRMYQRWAEDRGFKVEVLDLLPGEEAGIKSVSLLVKGKNAYGYLKGEKGVHRLVRISPFDASGRRHTSFASVSVLPEIDEDVHVEIRDEDLRIDTYRSSGAGGQHVNMTDSAVRITHLPTGIVVTCQSERSQIQNRERAMKILRARLLERALEEREKELKALAGEQKEIAWGNQIRSYVFHPYSLVKDHRTGVEVGNVQAVMDGELDPFIDAYLRWQAAGGRPAAPAEAANQVE